MISEPSIAEVSEALRLEDLPEVVGLRDGRKVSLRSARREDEPALHDFLGALSVESCRLRFFGVGTDLTEEAHRGVAGDEDHFSMVAIGPDDVVVGHGIYVRSANFERAEVAVEVSDQLHRQGLASMLVLRLAQVAEQHGIAHFFAEVLPENRDMVAVFRDGFAAVTIARPGEIEVEFATSSWRDAYALFEQPHPGTEHGRSTGR